MPLLAVFEHNPSRKHVKHSFIVDPSVFAYFRYSEVIRITLNENHIFLSYSEPLSGYGNFTEPIMVHKS